MLERRRSKDETSGRGWDGCPIQLPSQSGTRNAKPPRRPARSDARDARDPQLPRHALSIVNLNYDASNSTMSTAWSPSDGPARGKKRPLGDSTAPSNTAAAASGASRAQSAVSIGGDSVLSASSSGTAASATKKRRTDSLYSAHEQSAANYHGVIKPTPKPARDREPCYYGTYLQLDKITGAQKMRSACPEKPLGAHEEHLFIVIHQVYELWFKQILHEIDSVRRIFLTHEVVGAEMGVIVSRLARVKEIQRVLIDQLGVLETMTPQVSCFERGRERQRREREKR